MLGRAVQKQPVYTIEDYLNRTPHRTNSRATIPIPAGFAEHVKQYENWRFKSDDAFKALKVFVSLQNHPEAFKEFTSRDFDTQCLLIRRWNMGVNMANIRATLNLLRNSKHPFSKVDRWEVTLTPRKSLNTNCPDFSEDFHNLYTKFDRFQRNFLGPDWFVQRSADHSFAQIIVLMLVEKYGEEHVKRCIEMWIGNQHTNSIGTFTSLVENWQGETTVPLDWALSVAGVSLTTSKSTLKLFR